MRLRLLLLLAASFLALRPAATAQPLVVTSAASSGAGSLREAIATAAARGGTNQITFASSLNGAVIAVLPTEGGAFAISGQDLTIDAGSLPLGIALDARGTGQIFTVSAGASLALQRLELVRGKASGSGGAIASAGILALTDCTLSDHEASVRGGAISASAVTLQGCNFYRNAAPDGAALSLASPGNSLLTNCTLSSNVSSGANSGIVTCLDGTLRLIHCTLVENGTGADGGAVFIGTPASVTVERCIIAGNSEPSGSPTDLRLASGTLVASGPSLIGSNATVTAQFPAGALVGTAAAPLAARLAPLGFYGGPTRSRPPRDDSPALEAAAGSALTLDQRGFPRPAGGAADLGAVERGPLVTVTSTADSGPGSLREALAAASAPDTRIRFSGLPANSTILLASQLEIAAGRSVELEATAGLTIDGGNAGRHFFVHAGGALALRGTTLKRGQVSGAGAFGGSVYNQGSATLLECSLDTCSAAAGGAVVNFGLLALINSTVAENEASLQSGAIDLQSGRLHLLNVTVSGNRCTGGGTGGIGLAGTRSLAHLDHCTLTANRAVAAFGGILVDGGATLALINSIAAANLNGGAPGDLAVVGGGTVLLGGANVVRAASGALGGTAALTADPRLGPLGFQGGSTRTHSPLTGSAALDAAVGFPPISDQRGFNRHVGTAADLGAVERGPQVFVTKLADDGTAGSLSAVIAAATTPDTRVQFVTSLDAGTISTAGVFINDSSRVLEIDASTLPNGITLRSSNRGKVFDVSCSLSLNRVTIAEGFYGVQTRQSLVAVDSTFRDSPNDTTYGGALLANGDVALLRCTITGNLSGPIAMFGGRLNMENCTIAANRGSLLFSGGVLAAGADVRLLHCTLAGNIGSGVRLEDGATLRLERCIVAANQPTGEPDLNSTQGPSFVTAVGPNLVGNNATVESILPAGPLVGTTTAPLDPRLSAPVPAGGFTSVLLPLAGSPAIDAAGTSPLATDQRGFARAVGGIAASDLGAVERGPLLTVTNADDLGGNSLRAAIAAATQPDTRIEFSPDLSGRTIPLNGTTLEVPDFRNLAIDASNLPGGITIDAAFASTVLRIVGFNTAVTVQRVVFARGSSSTQGGAVHLAGGRLHLLDCVLRDSTTSGAGGGLNVVSGSAELKNCTISGNSGPLAGGVRIGARARLSNCTISGNTSSSGSANTGGLLADGVAEVRLIHCTITANSAASGVGGLRSNAPALTILERSIVAANFAPGALSPDLTGSTGTFGTTGPNLIGNASGRGDVFPSGPLVGTSAVPLDPQLSALTDNGGFTRTHFPLPGSPALDQGGRLSPLSTDQRGQPRSATAADLGSVEVGASDPAYARLVNVSTRLRAASGDSVPIAGFAVRDGSKRVAVRVLGPTLAQFGVPDVLANPTLQLVRSSDNATLATNDNWQDDASSAAALSAAGLGLPNASECGTVQTLAAGNYTAVVRGVGDTAGNCLVEVYDLETTTAPRLINLSTRGPVGTGDNVMIAGIVVGSGQPRRFLIRALGPSLTAFGVPAALPDPNLEVRSPSALLGTNDDWQSAQSAEISASGFAPPNSREPGLILTLGPGSYTAIVRGAGLTTGNALVEVYELP